MNYDIIIIGSGPGGYVAAIRASQLGLKVVIVEREELGGICLNWGCIPTKALLKSAQAYTYAKNASTYGVDITGEVKPNIASMVERSRTVAETMSKGIQYLLNKYEVDVIKGEADIRKDKTVVVKLTDNVSEVEYVANHIILATGSRSKELPALPQDGKKIIGYREAMTLDKLPETMLVVGSGAIGSEFAHFYQSIGVKVILVEYLPSIVPVEDIDISAQLGRCFKKKGMKILVNSTVVKVDTTGDKCKVYVSTKKGEEKFDVDIVLSAVGVISNIEKLSLEDCGIKYENGKIQVDDFYRTNVEGFYAIGDITKGPALAHVASHEALICVEKIAGHNPKVLNYSNIPGCTYTAPEVASVGITEAKALELGHKLRIGKFPFTASGKATASGNRDGFIKVVIDAESDMLLGCHMIGDNVTEMISEAVIIREKEISAKDIISTVHPHPTMSEAFMEAIAVAYDEVVHL